MSRKTGGKTVRLGGGMLRGKGPRDITESYKLLLTQDEYEEIEALVGNGSFSTAYFQTPSPDGTEDQLRVITGLRAEYHASKPIAATLTTIRVQGETAVRVTSQKYETDWDEIEETFTNAEDKNEGEEFANQDHYWYCDVGNWTVLGGTDDYLYCDTDSGYNGVYIRKTTGDDFVMSDGTVSVDVYVNSQGTSAGITARAQHDPTPTIYGYGYNLQVYTHATAANRMFILRRFDGDMAVDIAKWYDTTIAHQTYYTLKMMLQGDKIDCYANNEYLGTKYDATYSGGLIGCKTAQISDRYQNFKFELLKPIVVPLPVDAQSINQHITHEVVGNEGTLQYVIAPEGDMTYNQGEYSGGDVEAWDTTGALIRKPTSMKDLTGKLMVGNGLTQLEIIPQDGINPDINIYTLIDSSWEIIGQLGWQLQVFSDYFIHKSQTYHVKEQYDIRLVEVSRDRVVIELTTEHQDSQESDNKPIIFRYTIRAGFNGVLFEVVMPKSYQLLGLENWFSDADDYTGTSLAHRFAWVPGHDPLDALLDVTTSHITADDNHFTYFGPDLDAVVTQFVNRALYASYGFYVKIDGTEDRIICTAAFCDDSLAPCYRGGVAFSSGWYKSGVTYSGSNPFDGNLFLYREADIGYNDVTQSGGPGCVTSVGATYGDAHVVGTFSWVQWQIGVLPKGEYILFARAKIYPDGESPNSDYNFYVDNDGDRDGDYGFMNPVLTASWQYFPFVFHADGSENIYTSVEDMVGDADNGAHIDYWLLFPISNAHNWSLDSAHQAMHSVHLELNPRK